MARTKKYTAKEVADAIRQKDGVVRQAANTLGCHASTIYRYAEEFVTVREAMEESRQDTYAEAQAYLVAMMRDRSHKDHKWAVEQVLKTFGDKISDGLDWSDKQRLEHTGADGERLQGSTIVIRSQGKDPDVE